MIIKLSNCLTFKSGDSEKPPTKQTSEWWRAICPEEELDNIQCSAKLMLLFSIIADCSDRGEKLLVFSQSLLTLNVIEHFLSMITENTRQPNPTAKLGDFTGKWKKGIDYFRLDGSTNIQTRTLYCTTFNDENNTRARFVL